MKVLMFSGDPKILDKKSAVAKRMWRYGVMLKADDERSRLDIFLLVSKLSSEKIFKLSENVSVQVFTGKFLRFQSALRAARQMLKEQKYDLITAQDIERSRIAYSLSQQFHLPWQMQIHTDLFSPYFWRHSLFNTARVILARRLIPRASCIRVVSERIKHSIESRIKNKELKISVLPILEPVTIEGERKTFPEFEKIILTVARLELEKNVALAIEAMPEIVKKEPGVGLIIVGSGSRKQKLKELAQRLDVSKYVRFEEYQNDVTPYYRGANIYLQTSLYEGFGVAVYDAMRFGLPVIMTNAGIAESFVIDGTNGFIRQTAPEIAEAALRLLKSESLQRDFGEKSNFFVKMSDESKYYSEVVEQWKVCL